MVGTGTGTEARNQWLALVNKVMNHRMSEIVELVSDCWPLKKGSTDIVTKCARNYTLRTVSLSSLGQMVASLANKDAMTLL
jgi:hypothetical protein